jgi:hypothetical protein
MKKILYSLILGSFLIIGSSSAKAQSPGITDLFCEDFDLPVAQWGMTSTWTGIAVNPWFRVTDVTKSGSPGAAADTVVPGHSSALQTPLINVGAFTSISLSFDQIAYIEGLDAGRVQYRYANSGPAWTDIPAANYNGPSRYDQTIPGIPNNRPFEFDKNSQAPGVWQGVSNTYVWDAFNSINAWVREDFNVTSIVAAMPASANDQIQFRLLYVDELSSVVGRAGTHIWYVDNFCVKGGNCDLVPPVITFTDPPINYPNRYEDRVYLNGPWIFDGVVTDNRGQVDEVYVPYWVLRERGVVWDTISVDTVIANRLPGGNFRATIQPLMPNGLTISAGDSVFWKFEARDGSACRNLAQDPPVGLSKFLVRINLPPSCREADILYSFPYVEDFEGQPFKRSTTVIGDGWTNVTGDFHNWWVESQPSSNQGQYRILTDHPGGGNYLYVESAKVQGGSYKDSSAFLLSPCFDLAELDNGLVRFYANTNTPTTNDSIRVDIFDPTPKPGFPNGQFVKNVIPAIKGNKGNNWLPYEFSTFPYRNYITQIRFVGTPSGNSGLNDMAIDSFKIIRAARVDIRANSINVDPFLPSQGTASRQEVIVNVQNLGVANATNFTMGYQILDTAGNIIFAGPTAYQPGETLIPAENKNISFGPTNTYEVPLGQFAIKAWVNLPDSVSTNDTTFSNSRGLFYKDGNKYMDNFDKDTLWTILVDEDSLTNNWELGTPNYDYTYSSYSNFNSWDILLGRGYTGNGQVTSLLTPFLDFSTVDDAIISFINNRDINLQKDGVFIEYSFDRGATWDSVPSIQDPGRWKWNNSFIAAGGFGGAPVFSGVTYCLGNTWAGYLESELQLPTIFNNKKEVLFRFNFFAEKGGLGNDGMSIDNFLVYDPEPLDLQVQHFVGPTSKCDLQQDQRISTIIKNRGLTAVSTFSMEYTITKPDQSVVVKTDVINRPIAHRDTIHVTSQSTFDMFGYGDYIVQAKAILPNDFCGINDTLIRNIENVEGCSLLFKIETSNRPNFQQPCDSSVWKFNYSSSDGRSYQISQAYNDPRNLINLPIGIINTKIEDLFICMKGDSDVTFRLDDKDSLISNYSFIAYDGENDTTLYREVLGGPDSPVQRFKWICPPERSATPRRIILDNDRVQLPIEKKYDVAVRVLNNGLDSLDGFRLYFQIDDQQPIEKIQVHPSPNELNYNRSRVYRIDSLLLTEGAHVLKTWTTLPNNQQDLRVSDDTLEIGFTVMSVVPSFEFGSGVDPSDPNNPNVSASYCVSFDDAEDVPWVSANAYTLSQQNKTFDFGTPSSPNINGAFSGTNSWGTRVGSNYENHEEGMLLSPLFPVIKDSCYKISFKHNFYITDSIHDGGTVRMLNANATSITDYSDNVWDQVGTVTINDTLSPADTIRTPRGDTIIIPPRIIYKVVTPLGDTIFEEQNGWYKTRHILSIPGNNKNSGWTGTSNGWVTAESVLRPTRSYNTALMWRFESDGSEVSDGWVIDDFCIEQLPASSCYPVTVNENALDVDAVYLGQNIPNPASGNTVIPFYLPESGYVDFIVVNILGQPVYTESQNRPKGDGLISIETQNLSGGIYFYTLVVNGIPLTKRMIITK